jgi:hypothetical protein
MNRIASALLTAAIVASAAGCASANKQYIISTTNGRMEVATTKPQAVPGTNLYVYSDRYGAMQTMRQTDLAQVMER